MPARRLILMTHTKAPKTNPKSMTTGKSTQVKAPQRIAIFVATSGHSGVDRAMKLLIPSLAQRGYFVDVLKVRRHGPVLEDIPERVSVIDLGSKHVYTCLPGLIRYLKKFKPDVMHAAKDRVNRTALAAVKISGVNTRLILGSGTTISVDLQHRGRFERWLQRTSMGKLYKYAEKTIVTCDDVADDMANYTGLDRNLIEHVASPVLPDNTLETHFEKPAHPWFDEGSPPVIISVGELSKRKDFATLIKAFSIVRQSINCRLIILGKGKEKENLQTLIDQLQLEHDVSLPGFVDNPLAFMAHAKLFAFTSQWEGLGFVLIEAMAVGTPVVSTLCPSGPREILQDGKYGKLVPVGDIESMADAMLSTLKHCEWDKHTLQQAVRQYTVSEATNAHIQAFGLEQIDTLTESA